MLAEKLKKFRQNKNLTQKELAELSMVPQSTICYIENGKSPRTDTLQKIAKALGVTVADLLDETA